MKIAFLDYQLTNSHMKKFLSLLRGPIGGAKVEVIGANELSPTEQGRKWCEENNLPYVESAEELVASSDAVLVLAPNNPEKHLEVAGPALTTGRPLFIDKVLAHRPDHAREIVAVAKKAGTPLMSSSALRFAPEFEELEKRIQGKIETVFARGLGKFPIYAVHTIAPALRFFGHEIKRVIDTGDAATHLITLDDGRRRASVEVRESKNPYEATPWQVGVLAGERYETATVKDTNGYYENLMRNMVEFFQTGKSPIALEEQVAVVAVQAAAEQSLSEGGRWVSIE